MLVEIADDWPARNTWTVEQLSMKYGDTDFKISQRSSRKVSMKFKDYVSYMNSQHDEDPLYIFDDKVLLILLYLFPYILSCSSNFTFYSLRKLHRAY
jgi:hypothetical protein